MSRIKIKPTSLLIALCVTSASALSQTPYNDPWWSQPGLNTDFFDPFSSAQLDRNLWKVESDIFVNGEDIDYQDVEFPSADWTVASAQDDAGAIDGKALILKARYMDGAIQDYYGGDPENPGKPLFIRSGRIESQITDETTFTYGKFEARIKVPPARRGEFPAWWLLGNYPDVGWTACQELDIMEYTGLAGDSVPQTHWTAPYAVHGSTRIPYADVGVADPQNNYITYGVIKTPSKVEWYINGVLTKTFSRDNQGDDQPWPYVTPMRMILNHAITHVEWPDVGNYNAFSTDPNVANRTGYSYTDSNGVRQYEYIDTDAMAANIGREGTDFTVDYVAHWPLPDTDAEARYTDGSKRSFFRESGNTDGFYNLKGWLAPVSVTADAYDNNGNPDDERNNGGDNAADGYVGSKWATPSDDNTHWVEVDYGEDKLIDYLWLEWSWNLPAAYEIYGKSEGGNWELLDSRTQRVATWSTHTVDVNNTYRYLKLVTLGRIDKANPIWLLELKAFETGTDTYPQPEETALPDPEVNAITNGDFSSGLTRWIAESFDGADPVYGVNADRLTIDMTNDGATEGSAQIHQGQLQVEHGYRYTLAFDAFSASSREISVRLSSDTLNPSPGQTILKESVPLTTASQHYSYTIDYMRDDIQGRIAFLLGNMGTETVNIDNVVLRREERIATGPTLVGAILPVDFQSASAGWETEWWGVAQRAVDGSLGTKASGNDGESEDQTLSISVNIQPGYEVKAVKVAGDNSPERSLDLFRVEWGDGNVLLDWTASQTDAEYETFTELTSYPPANERNFTFFFAPPAGQLVEVTDVQLMAIDLRPYDIRSVALDNTGTISPSNTLSFSNSQQDSQTYQFLPDAGFEVADVLIDGVSVGAVSSYTFTDISSSHTIAVSFRASTNEPEVSDITSLAAATASTEMQPAYLAIDGDSGTRWESTHNIDPSFIQLDFGQLVQMNSVVIHWEAANAETYTIEGSLDGVSWDTLASFSGGVFGDREDTLALTGTVRYLKIVGTSRSQGNQWGYSIYEIKVMGNPE